MSQFEELLRASIGLDAESIGRSAVDRAVRERARICGVTVAEYGGHVGSSVDELQALIDAVVVPETWFFRDQPSFDLLAHLAREKWLARPGGVMRLLSLPSSTGEEPYSMSMTLLDAGLPAHRFAIDAIDVSERPLERARQAVYGRNSFRGASLAFRDRYFDEHPGGHRLRDHVRLPVRFRRGNIRQPASIGEAGAYDVIFCRNLLIYFDRATQEQSIDLLERLLAPEGLLVVAPSETNLMLRRPAQWDRAASGFGFRRRASTAPPRTARVLSMPSAFAPEGAASDPAPAGAAADTPTGRTPIDKPVAPSRVSAIAAATASATAPASDASLESAARLADAGRLAEAVAACERHLAEHGPSPEAFQLLGVLRDATGDSAEAIACYRKSLYMDPRNEEVLARLALLLDKVDRKAEATVVRARAQRLARAADHGNSAPAGGVERPAPGGVEPPVASRVEP